jgi:hypothetical protein
MTSVLLRPFAYLTIRHDSGRLPWVNWGLPLVLAAAALLGIGAVAPGLNIFHAGGLLDRLLGFVQTLPGFYLAALAAVATFGRENLDRVMPGTPPRAKIPYNGRLTDQELTRRRFLTMLFAYLTALSIALTLAAVLAITLVDPIAAAIPAALVHPLRTLGAFAFMTFIAQLLVITLWGLYYLSERIHTPD